MHFYISFFKIFLIMPERIFVSCLNLKMSNKEVESDFQKMRAKKLKFLNIPIILFSLVSSLAVMIFHYLYYDEFIEIKFFKFNVIMCSIASGIYLILMAWGYSTKNIKIIKWINYTIFYFQIYVIIAFRFAIIKVTHASSFLLFFEYLFEIIVRLIWVILFLHSFLESCVLNILSLVTVWLVVPILFTEKLYNEEIINTLAYSFVLFSVIIIAYVLERQQKQAFYFHWQADTKAKWLTNVFENLNSGFVSVKNSKISYVNSYFKNFLKNLKLSNQSKKENKLEVMPIATAL
jgi:hypothetical protein